MKGVLFDQNLPSKIIFKPAFPVRHVTAIGANPTDTEIWDTPKKTS